MVMSGGLFHGFQLWVNLPARLKMTNPRYQDIRSGEVALLSSADGGYIDNSGSIRPFLAGEQNGRWAAIEVPGIASLLSSIPGHAGNAEVSAMSCLNGYCLAGALSCLSTGYCLAGGYYDDYFGQRQAFVVSRP